MAEEIPPCNIRIDKEGKWYYQGLPIINENIYRQLNQCVIKDKEGRYLLEMDGEKCCLEVEDTPFVIQSVGVDRLPSGDTALRVTANDGNNEVLDVSTLRIGEDNILYCKIKAGMFDARFTRAGYYQLAQFLQQDEKGYCLVVENKKTPLPQLQG